MTVLADEPEPIRRPIVGEINITTGSVYNGTHWVSAQGTSGISGASPHLVIFDEVAPNPPRPFRHVSDHNSGSAMDVRAPRSDAFVDAMANMQEALQRFSESLSAVGGSISEMVPLVAYQSAVMRDCLMTEEEKAAADDALWECHALSIRMEPRVFQADFRMFDTTMLGVHHGLFTRDVAVQVFNLRGEEYPPEDFLVFVQSVNSVEIQFVGHAFRKPPFQHQTRSQRDGSKPSALRVRVSA